MRRISFSLRHLAATLLASIIFGATATAAGLEGISSGDASSGVTEALAKGADYAVSSLGKENGFLGNPKVRIPLPESLKTVEKGLRAFGRGKQADELIDAMNHAAEKAVAEARPILLDSVRKMTLHDAKDILLGGEDSVTQFFKRTSSGQLAQKFSPVVKEATRKVQLAEQYNKFASKAAGSGLIDKKDADLDAYVTQKAMDGLFVMIAEQEKNLRQNPLGAGSDLLRKVFGSL